MDLKDYKAGVYFGEYTKYVFCLCGFSAKVREKQIMCEKCGNEHFAYGGRVITNRRIYDGIFTCVDKNDKSFHLKKTEIMVTFSKDTCSVSVKPTYEWELKYNLKGKTIFLAKDGKEVNCFQNNYANINRFFKWIKMEQEIIPIFSTDLSKTIYDFAYREYGAYRNEYVNKLGRALVRLLDKSDKLELFTFSGFGHNLYNIARTHEWFYSSETKPHKIFGVPKYMLSILRDLETFSRSDVRRLLSLNSVVDSTNIKNAVEILKEESKVADLIDVSDILCELYLTYGYKNFTRLILYLAREVKLEQGITSVHTAATTLRDYVRMCLHMGIKPKEKYPKSLKKMHDITYMNYYANVDEIKNKRMREITSSKEYQELTFAGKQFAIITPNTASDLIKEGSSLSHCVASYVDDVIDGKCKILFLRNASELDKPLVTIEVRGKNIRQVRGFSNRDPLPEEKDFIKTWANAKKLNISVR